MLFNARGHANAEPTTLWNNVSKGEGMKVVIQNAVVIIAVIFGLILATLLGIYGQDLSYYFNDRFPAIELAMAITVINFLGIGLYIIIPSLLLIFKKMKGVYLFGFVLIGLPISIWAFFVWAMWMG